MTLKRLAESNLTPFIGACKLKELTADNVDDWLEARRDHLTTRTLQECSIKKPISSLNRASRYSPSRPRRGQRILMAPVRPPLVSARHTSPISPPPRRLSRQLPNLCTAALLGRSPQLSLPITGQSARHSRRWRLRTRLAWERGGRVPRLSGPPLLYFALYWHEKAGLRDRNRPLTGGAKGIRTP